jgi:Uma2 family endonuclease
MTREAYYAWCGQQERGRFERIDGEVVAMAPERGAHLLMKSEMWLALRQAIAVAGVACQALPDGATVSSGDSDYEPDAVVNCGPRMAFDATHAPNPVVVVEVLSPGTQSVDTGVKLAGYFLVPSIVHYLIVHPTKPQIIHHRRRADSTGIDTTILASGTLRLDPPGLLIDIDALYKALS